MWTGAISYLAKQEYVSKERYWPWMLDATSREHWKGVNWIPRRQRCADEWEIGIKKRNTVKNICFLPCCLQKSWPMWTHVDCLVEEDKTLCSACSSLSSSFPIKCYQDIWMGISERVCWICVIRWHNWQWLQHHEQHLESIYSPVEKTKEDKE